MIDANKICESILLKLNDGDSFARLAIDGKRHIVAVKISNDTLLDDLHDIEKQKKSFLNNFDNFLTGKYYQHVLLWGARGCGKSSLIRAGFLHCHYHYKQQLQNELNSELNNKLKSELKILQIANDDLGDLAFLLWVLSQSQDKFIIYIDDLSFTPQDDSYRALKAVLDGSISGIANNIMLCVTSNRRHLLAEFHHDERAIHPQEDIEEQISLADRFGLRLAFHSLTQSQFLNIIEIQLAKRQIASNAHIQNKALRYSLARGSRSARVAMQFAAKITNDEAPQ